MECRHCGSKDLKKIVSDYFKCNTCGKGTTPKALNNRDCTEYADSPINTNLNEMEV